MTLPTHVQRVLALDPFDLLTADFRRPAAAYAVDVREDADRLYVEAEVPGFKKDEIEIVLDKSTLTITAAHAKAEADPAAEASAGQWLLRERRTTRFQRAFTLPRSADGATVSAKLEDGVLSVTLTKREETKPRKITVN